MGIEGVGLLRCVILDRGVLGLEDVFGLRIIV